MSRVLLVEDDPQLLRAMRITLRAHGHDVVTAETGRKGISEAAGAHPGKLEPDPSRTRHLITEPGMGYRFQP